MVSLVAFLLCLLQVQLCVEVTVDGSWSGKAEYKVFADGSFTLKLTKNFGEGYEYSASTQVSVDSIRSLIQDLSDLGYFSLKDTLIDAMIHQEERRSSRRWLVYDYDIYDIRIPYNGVYHSFHSYAAKSYVEKYPDIKELSTADHAIDRIGRFLFILDDLAKSPQVQNRFNEEKQ